MNRNEIGKFIDRTWGQGNTDTPTILQEIRLSKYKFDKDEILEIFNSINNKNGLITTPTKICELISVIGHLSSPKSIVDICCGTGNILHQFKNASIKKGIDINKNVVQLAKLINPDSEYEIFDSLKYDFGKSTYDLVLGSMPFGIKTEDNISLEIELIKKGLTLLKQHGCAIFVVSENILSGSKENEFRKFLLSDYAIDMVISLPSGTFYPYSQITTAILVIRKGKQNDEIFMPFFDNNPNTLISSYINHNGNFFCPISKINSRLDRNYYLTVDIVRNLDLRKQSKKLSDMAMLYRGQVIKRELLKKKGRFLIYHQQNIEGEKCYVDDIKDEKSILRPNDLVISLNSDNENIHIHKINDPETVITKSHALIRSIDNTYIYNYLQSINGLPSLWLKLKQKKIQFFKPQLSVSRISNIKIPILPLTELNFLNGDWIHNASSNNISKTENNLKELISIYEKEDYSQNLILNSKNKNCNENEFIIVEHKIKQEIIRERIPKIIKQQKFKCDPNIKVEKPRILFQRNYQEDISINNSEVKSNFNLDDIHLKMLYEMYEMLVSQKKILLKMDNKIDAVLLTLKDLNIQLNIIKNNHRDTEEKLDKINSLIDKNLKKIATNYSDDIDTYKVQIKRWLADWELLHSLTLIFLTSAELIYDHLPNNNDTDYSPFIIQYCRALENEILKKLFENYHVYIIENAVDRKQLVSFDKLNEKTKIFADCVEKDKRDYTLGSMSFIMNCLKEGGKTLNGSPLLQNFRCFTLEYFEARVLQKEFLTSVTDITANYRNKSAHPYVLSVEMADECQKIIKKLLIDFLSNYKRKPLSSNYL